MIRTFYHNENEVVEYEQYKPLTSMNTSVLRKDLYYRCVSCEPVISLDTTCTFIVFNCCRINTTFSRRCWRCTTSTSPLSSTHASTATSLPFPLASPSISTSSLSTTAFSNPQIHLSAFSFYLPAFSPQHSVIDLPTESATAGRARNAAIVLTGV